MLHFCTLQCSIEYLLMPVGSIAPRIFFGYWILFELVCSVLQKLTLYSIFNIVILDSCSWCLLYIILLMVPS